MRFPAENATMALDYRIDRPLIAGIRLDPPVLAHGQPVTIDALVLAPPGVEAAVTSIDVCGLQDDLIADVYAMDCFNEPELVDHIASTVPATWDPPDHSAIPCPQPYTYDTGGPWVDSGIDTATPPSWNIGACRSYVPLLVEGTAGDEPFYGGVYAFLRVEPIVAGEFVPEPLWDKPRHLSYTPNPVAGGYVDLEFRIDARIDDEGFRWWIDAGELLGTGRTTTQYREGDTFITTNRLLIPSDWHGPLRVFVVAESADSDAVPYSADLAWEQLVLEVP